MSNNTKKQLTYYPSLMSTKYASELEYQRKMSEIKKNPKFSWVCYDCGTDSNIKDKRAIYECSDCTLHTLRRLCEECNKHHHRSGKATTHNFKLIT